MKRHFEVVLISTYELGRQPFGLASPAAWLREAGAAVTCCDLSLEQLNPGKIRAADLVAFYLPMHTATRLAIPAIRLVRSLNPKAHLCAYGLYAATNAGYLQKEGVQTLLGGEFEEGLRDLAMGLSQPESQPAIANPAPASVSLQRQQFLVPDRSGLPALNKYARLALAEDEFRMVGYTEASRGCKHLCRHCPIVPVYNGAFRVVQPEIVLEDIRQQVAQGARHITFGDPDFFNGVGHAMRIVEAFHREFSGLTYDVTIKVEHLKKHTRQLKALKDTGCLFVISAVEAVDDRVLEIFAKGHTRADFMEVTAACREAGLHLAPTFVAFTPWTTLESYREMLALIAKLDLVANVAPIQWAIRLLIPAGSRLLEMEETRAVIGEFNEAALTFPWAHPDPRMDDLQKQTEALAIRGASNHRTRAQIFQDVWAAAQAVDGSWREPPPLVSRAAIPYLTEPWYC